MNRRMLESLWTLLVQGLLALVFGFVTLTANAAGTPGQKHIFWAPGQAPSPNSLSSDLIYHGGDAGPGAIGVETSPAVYLIFWGPDWANGFTTTDVNGRQYTSQQLQNYVVSFFTNLGGTSWAAIQTEYCRNATAGSTSCADVA